MSVVDLTVGDAARLLPQRPLDMHKGDRGTIMIAGGCERYPGAPSLSALAALRSGGGVVSLLSSPQVCQACAARLPEVVQVPTEGDWFPSALEQQHIAAAAVGPGLGRSAKSVSFSQQMWRQWRQPLLVDGDGLFALAALAVNPDDAPARSDAVLTPHEGEAARLLNVSAEDIRGDRVSAAMSLAQRWSCVLLKGHGTLVVDKGTVYRLQVGGPELSVPGSGDVLSGCICAFMAMGLAPLEAALLGGTLHGLAGAHLRDKKGVDGLLASEIADELPFVIRELRR